MNLREKITDAEKTIQLAADMSEFYYHKPLIICYSGGKDSDMDMSTYSYARGRGSNAKRDSMGRYSSEGGYSNARDGRRRGGYSRTGYSYHDGEKEEKVEMLREMMQEAGSEEERRALQKIIRRMEQE